MTAADTALSGKPSAAGPEEGLAADMEEKDEGAIVGFCKIGPVAFSSLAAKREWLQSDVARAFMRAYTKTRAYMLATPAMEIAKAEKSYFPTIDIDVLAGCIARGHPRRLRLVA